jgi:hypothetical protein
LGRRASHLLGLKMHTPKSIVEKSRAVREGVSKGEEDGRRPPALRAGHPPNGPHETFVRPWIPLPVRAWKREVKEKRKGQKDKKTLTKRNSREEKRSSE